MIFQVQPFIIVQEEAELDKVIHPTLLAEKGVVEILMAEMLIMIILQQPVEPEQEELIPPVLALTM